MEQEREIETVKQMLLLAQRLLQVDGFLPLWKISRLPVQIQLAIEILSLSLIDFATFDEAFEGVEQRLGEC